MAEDGHDDGKPEEERDRADHQARRDDEAPGRHRAGIGGHRAQRRQDGGRQADIPVEEERKGHHADREDEQREQEADADADHDHHPAGGGREHVAEERCEGGRRLRAERGRVDRVRRRQPDEEDRQEHEPEHEDRDESRRGDHPEGVRPAHRKAMLAPAAHFIEADGGDRPEQRETGGEREKERQHVGAERQPRQDQADQRIDQAQQNDVGAAFREVGEPARQRVPEIGHFDPPHGRRRGIARLLGAMDETAGLLDGMPGELELIEGPFNGIADISGHVRSSRTDGVTGRVDRRGGEGQKQAVVTREPRPGASILRFTRRL